jgi:hypothetical protein
MTAKPFYREAKKWETLLPNGDPNLGSYEAENANRIASWAWKISEEAGGGASNPELLEIARTLTYVVSKAAGDSAKAPVGMGTALWSQAFWTLKSVSEEIPVDVSDLEGWAIAAAKAVYRLLGLSRKILTENLEANGELIEPNFDILNEKEQ